MKVPLTGSAYTSRSLIASAQRSVNLYSEHNPEDSPFPATYYPTPGLTLIASAPVSEWRGLYMSTTGVLYGVCSNRLYTIDSNFNMKFLWNLNSSTGPVSMVDNGQVLIIVDGTATGYVAFLTTNGRYILDASLNFYGADIVDFVDGFFIFNNPGTNQWYISGYMAYTFDPLDFATKSGFSDNIVAVGVTNRQVFVFGTQTTEIWYNTGSTAFTFARMPGAFIQFGCAAAATVQQIDNSLYWLSQSPQGGCLVLQSKNYDKARISTFAIEKAFQSYSRVDDATSYTYQQEGHTFYVLNFPTANKTWCYDLSTAEWHERTFMDSLGNENRQLSNCHAVMNGQHIVGDWQSGNLYVLDSNVYTDNGSPIHRVRSFPHLLSDGDRVMYRTLIADMEVGVGDASTLAPAEIRLRWSDTKGASWGSYISQDMGAKGDFLTCVQFQRLGMGRDRVFELSWSGNVKTALSGAFIDAQPSSS